jgi:hypothetical protein
MRIRGENFLAPKIHLEPFLISREMKAAYWRTLSLHRGAGKLYVRIAYIYNTFVGKRIADYQSNAQVRSYSMLWSLISLIILEQVYF